MELNKIYNMDAIEGLKQLEDNSIDAIITDPPYNISQDGKMLYRNNLNAKSFRSDSSIKLDFGEWDKMAENDFYDFTESWFRECARVLKPKGWFFSFFSRERIGYFSDPRNGLFSQYGFKTRTIIAWHKTNPPPSFRKVNFLSATEFIVVGSKGGSKIPNFLKQVEMHNFFETPNGSSYKETTHPTEKPVSLTEWLAKVSTNEGEVIMDPFMGSGTTAISAIFLNRSFIGFEREKEYFEIANARINYYSRQKKETTNKMFVNLDNFLGGEKQVICALKWRWKNE
jgi:DNA modification methylase